MNECCLALPPSSAVVPAAGLRRLQSRAIGPPSCCAVLLSTPQPSANHTPVRPPRHDAIGGRGGGSVLRAATSAGTSARAGAGSRHATRAGDSSGGSILIERSAAPSSSVSSWPVAVERVASLSLASGGRRSQRGQQLLPGARPRRRLQPAPGLLPLLLVLLPMLQSEGRGGGRVCGIRRAGLRGASAGRGAHGRLQRRRRRSERRARVSGGRDRVAAQRGVSEAVRRLAGGTGHGRAAALLRCCSSRAAQRAPSAASAQVARVGIRVQTEAGAAHGCGRESDAAHKGTSKARRAARPIVRVAARRFQSARLAASSLAGLAYARRLLPRHIAPGFRRRPQRHGPFGSWAERRRARRRPRRRSRLGCRLDVRPSASAASLLALHG